MSAEVITTRELLKRVGAWEDAGAAQQFLSDLGTGFRAVGNGFTAWRASSDGWFWEQASASQHVWFASGLSVHHSSRGYGHGSDSIGVGLGEDRLGPFPSQKMAARVADAMTHAYELGWSRK